MEPMAMVTRLLLILAGAVICQSYPYQQQQDTGTSLFKKMIDELINTRVEYPETNELPFDETPMKVEGGTHEGGQHLGPYGTFANEHEVLTDPYDLGYYSYYPPGEDSYESAIATNDEPPTEEDAAEKPYPAPVNPCPIGYSETDGCLEEVPDAAWFSKSYQESQVGKSDPEHNYDENPYRGGEKRLELVAKKAPIIRRRKRSAGPNPYLNGVKTRTVAKKSPTIR